MPVVTVFRQAGSGGRYVAEKVTQALGYHLLDYKTVESIMHEYGMVQFKDIYGSAPDFWERFTARGAEREELARMLGLVTLAGARHGDVVMLGRACFVPLQGFSDVINVRVKAALSLRITRIMKRDQISYEEAAEFVKEKDRLVEGFASLYGVSPDDANMFDLVIDTGKVAPDLAVQFLVETVRGIHPDTGAERSTGSIEVDEVLVGAVTSELHREALR